MKRDPLNFFVNLSEKTDHYAWLGMPGQNVLFLNDPVGIYHVLKTNDEHYWKGKYNQVLKPIFGKGIFLAEGEDWKSQRKMSAPAFAGKYFPGMTQEMINSANLMFDRMDEQIEQGKNVDVNLEMMWFTLDVVLRALFDTKKDNIAYDVKESLGVILKEAEHRIWAALPLPQKYIMKLPKYKTARNRLIDITAEIIEDSVKNDDSEDLLTKFKKLYSSGDDKQSILIDQVLSFLLAGHETTANALAWAFYELGRNPSLQDVLLDEIDMVLEDKPVSFESIKDLSLAKSFFYEILRLYPPIWSMSREALQDDIIPLDQGEVFLPKGSTVMMCAYSMHRNSKLWEHPEALIPDRFVKTKRENGYKYFPFGGGPRVCLGQKFAEVESVVMIVMFLQRYNFTLAPGQTIRPVPSIALKPDNKIYLKLERRNQALSEILPMNYFDLMKQECPAHQKSKEAA